LNATPSPANSLHPGGLLDSVTPPGERAKRGSERARAPIIRRDVVPETRHPVTIGLPGSDMLADIARARGGLAKPFAAGGFISEEAGSVARLREARPA
jgi:hypothetical protein